MPKIARLTMLLIAAMCIAGSGELPAQAGIYRCVDENGIPVFADRNCSFLGAREYDALPDEPPPSSLPSLIHGCPRQVDMLVTWVRAALESGDVNHLSGLYHWADATPPHGRYGATWFAGTDPAFPDRHRNRVSLF